MTIPTDDAGIARLVRDCGFPPDIMNEMAVELQQPSIMESAGVHPHLHAMCSECHQDTRFATRGAHDPAATFRGSQPGDPFGDVIIGLLVSSRLRDVRAKIRAAVSVPPAEKPTNTVMVFPL